MFAGVLFRVLLFSDLYLLQSMGPWDQALALLLHPLQVQASQNLEVLHQVQVIQSLVVHHLVLQEAVMHKEVPQGQLQEMDRQVVLELVQLQIQVVVLQLVPLEVAVLLLLAVDQQMDKVLAQLTRDQEVVVDQMLVARVLDQQVLVLEEAQVEVDKEVDQPELQAVEALKHLVKAVARLQHQEVVLLQDKVQVLVLLVQVAMVDLQQTLEDKEQALLVLVMVAVLREVEQEVDQLVLHLEVLRHPVKDLEAHLHQAVELPKDKEQVQVQHHLEVVVLLQMLEVKEQVQPVLETAEVLKEAEQVVAQLVLLREALKPLDKVLEVLQHQDQALLKDKDLVLDQHHLVTVVQQALEAKVQVQLAVEMVAVLKVVELEAAQLVPLREVHKHLVKAVDLLRLRDQALLKGRDLAQVLQVVEMVDLLMLLVKDLDQLAVETVELLLGKDQEVVQPALEMVDHQMLQVKDLDQQVVEMEEVLLDKVQGKVLLIQAAAVLQPLVREAAQLQHQALGLLRAVDLAAALQMVVQQMLKDLDNHLLPQEKEVLLLVADQEVDQQIQAVRVHQAVPRVEVAVQAQQEEPPVAVLTASGVAMVPIYMEVSTALARVHSAASTVSQRLGAAVVALAKQGCAMDREYSATVSLLAECVQWRKSCYLFDI